MEYDTTEDLVRRGCGVDVEVVVKKFLSRRSGTGIRQTILDFIMHLTRSKDWRRIKSTLQLGIRHEWSWRLYRFEKRS